MTTIAALLFALAAQSQSDSTLPKTVGDTLIASCGFKVYPGQKLKMGYGTQDDGDFKYIMLNQSGFAAIMTSTNNNGYNKQQQSLSRQCTNKIYEVQKIVKRGNKKNGYQYFALVLVGMGMRYQIDVDAAITSGELSVPDEFKPKKAEPVVIVQQSTSVADELTKLKKLFDDGVITKDEFEAQKKKLLNQ